jgi:glucose dehydrogenase
MKMPFPTITVPRRFADAYLTVFDAKSGESLWTDSHIWGGLVTGRNSAGARLISQLKREMKK